MFEKSPTGSVIVGNASVFVTKNEDLFKNLKILLQHFGKIKILTAISHAMAKLPSSMESFLKMI